MIFQSATIAITLLILFLVIQLFYYLFFFARLAFYKNKSTAVATENQFFSIVICAKNEETNVRNNLPHWMAQVYNKADGTPNYEVIVVDDNSEDGSSYEYAKLTPQYAHLRVLQLQQSAKGIMGKKFPLSMGIKEAKSDYLLLTDADCVPSSNLWLQEMARQHSMEKEIVLGFAPYKTEEGFLNTRIRYETFITAIQYLGYALAGLPYMGVGRNLSYKRQLFNSVKGFSSHNMLLSGDDDLFINKVANSKNTAICIEPNAFLYSNAKTTLEDWHMQKRRHLSSSNFYKGKHKFLLGLYAVSHILFWIAVIWCCCSIISLPFAVGAVVLRWFVLYLVGSNCAKKLHQQDLSKWLIPMDLYWLGYYVRMFPNLFKKQVTWN
jgi:glycosyltransferase involved in cell wall biosynthesis